MDFEQLETKFKRELSPFMVAVMSATVLAVLVSWWLAELALWIKAVLTGISLLVLALGLFVEKRRAQYEILSYDKGDWFWDTKKQQQQPVQVISSFASQWLISLTVVKGKKRFHRIYCYDAMPVRQYWLLKRLVYQPR